MSELGPAGHALLEAARAARPTAAARARIDAGLAARLGAAPVPAPSPAPAPGLAAAVGPVAKVIAVAALIAAGGAGALTRTTPAHPPETPGSATAAPAERAEPAASPSEPPPTLPTADPSSTPPAPPEIPRPRAPLAPRAERAPRPRIEARPPSAGTLDEELASLRAAQQALKQGDGARALAALDDLAARHPEGLLREERLAARVLGLCAAGRVAEAREAGRRFLAELPGSVQAERVRASCAFATAGDPDR